MPGWAARLAMSKYRVPLPSVVKQLDWWSNFFSKFITDKLLYKMWFDYGWSARSPREFPAV